MTRRALIPTAGTVAIGLVASLVLATPSPLTMADLARSSGTRLLASPAADGTDLLSREFAVADGFTANGLARLRRRDSTMDRGERTSRRGPASRTTNPAASAKAPANGARRVVSREQVALGGCRYFLQHATLDMDGLAQQLAVSRATLYRVVHSRDRLLADVLWRLAENALWRARKERTQYGVEGVLQVGRRFCTLLLDAKQFRTFLTSEPDAAARVLLTAGGGVHHRAVQAQKEIFVEATPPGQVWPGGDLDSLAYLLVRIFESTFYADLLASRVPDRDLAERAIRAVLPATD